MHELAKKHQMVMVVPVYEEEMTGVYYNTAAVIDADGKYLGKYRKTHIPHASRASGRSSTSRRATWAIPSSRPRTRKVGVYICYDRHFPEGARALGLNGAEIVFNPSATVAGLSEYLWKLEQPAHAVANGYFVGAINRVGTEAPWNIGEFYGKSLLLRSARQHPGRRRAATRTSWSSPICDLDMIEEVRTQWQFYRDRRPEMYGTHQPTFRNESRWFVAAPSSTAPARRRGAPTCSSRDGRVAAVAPELTSPRTRASSTPTGCTWRPASSTRIRTPICASSSSPICR